MRNCNNYNQIIGSPFSIVFNVTNNTPLVVVGGVPVVDFNPPAPSTQQWQVSIILLHMQPNGTWTQYLTVAGIWVSSVANYAWACTQQDTNAWVAGTYKVRLCFTPPAGAPPYMLDPPDALVIEVTK